MPTPRRHNLHGLCAFCGKAFSRYVNAARREREPCRFCSVRCGARARYHARMGGLSVTHPTEFQVWHHMHARCRATSGKEYKYWASRGIRVCERWASLANFIADMGRRPPGTSIDRIDPNGNYEPGNCRWATHREQSLNLRSTTKIRLSGVTMSLHEACAALRVSYAGARSRLRRGFGIYALYAAPGKAGALRRNPIEYYARRQSRDAE